MAAGVTVTEAVFEEPLAVAVTTTEVLVVTVAAETVKVVRVAPAPTVTEAGVVRAVLLSVRVTTWPPVGAAEVSVMVQVEVLPEVMEVGEQERRLGVARGVTVMAAVLEALLAVAVTVTDVLAVTEAAETVKVAEVAPAPTVTEAGVVRAELLSASVTI